MSFSRKRQRFLVNQGYSYKVITRLAGMDEVREMIGERVGRVRRVKLSCVASSYGRCSGNVYVCRVFMVLTCAGNWDARQYLNSRFCH